MSKRARDTFRPDGFMGKTMAELEASGVIGRISPTQKFIDQFDVAEQQNVSPLDVSPMTEDIGIKPKRSAKKSSAPSQTSNAKNARRLIRQFLRAAMELSAAADEPTLYTDDEKTALLEAFNAADAALAKLPGYEAR